MEIIKSNIHLLVLQMDNYHVLQFQFLLHQIQVYFVQQFHKHNQHIVSLLPIDMDNKSESGVSYSMYQTKQRKTHKL